MFWFINHGVSELWGETGKRDERWPEGAATGSHRNVADGPGATLFTVT